MCPSHLTWEKSVPCCETFDRRESFVLIMEPPEPECIFLLGAARPRAYDLGWANTRSCLELWNWISDTKTNRQSRYYLRPCFHQDNGNSRARPEAEVSVAMVWHFPCVASSSFGSCFISTLIQWLAFLPVLWATQHPLGKLLVLQWLRVWDSVAVLKVIY